MYYAQGYARSYPRLVCELTICVIVRFLLESKRFPQVGYCLLSVGECKLFRGRGRGGCAEEEWEGVWKDGCEVLRMG